MRAGLREQARPSRRGPAVRRLAGGLALLALLASPAAGQKDRGDDSDALPPGKFGMSLGVRQGLGKLSDDYGLGMIGAAEAGYHPTDTDSSLSLGLSWSVVWSWFGSDDQASIAGSLRLLEFNFGGRVRRILGEPGSLRFLVLGTGVSLLRANVPIPPDLDRVYLGPYASLGVEQFLWENVLLSFETRYGLIVGGPGTISISFGIGFGT